MLKVLQKTWFKLFMWSDAEHLLEDPNNCIHWMCAAANELLPKQSEMQTICDTMPEVFHVNFRLTTVCRADIMIYETG